VLEWEVADKQKQVQIFKASDFSDIGQSEPKRVSLSKGFSHRKSLIQAMYRCPEINYTSLLHPQKQAVGEVSIVDKKGFMVVFL